MWLHVTFYRDHHFTTAPVLCHHTQAVLVDAEGPFEPRPEKGQPGLRLVVRCRDYICAELTPEEEQCRGIDRTQLCGPMFGGAFIWSSDSRFPSRQPIPVHDRYETPERYDMLSR